MEFNKLLKVLHTLIFVVGILLFAGSIYLVVKAWPAKPSFDPKIFWIILNSTFLIFFIVSLNIARKYRPHLTFKRKSKRAPTAEEMVIIEHWRSVRHKAFSGDTNSMRLAIIEADKILDDVLRNVGFTAETVSDKILQILSDDLYLIRNKATDAHEYYLKLESDPDYEVDFDEVKKAIYNYEAVLKELNIVDPAEL
ncbi:MAG: hypothetical protein AAB738_01030 [Patescibacteria group bacterium]